MATLPAEEKVEFLIELLASMGDFKPNYAVLAETLGINTNANVQRRFKGIVEADKKFVLQCTKEGTSIVKVGGNAGDAGEGKADTTSTPKKTPASAKGRKRNKPATADDDDEQTKTPSKVSKKTPKKAGKSNEERNEDEQEEVSHNDDTI